MEVYSSRKSASQFHRSLSPSGRFCSSSISTHPTRTLTRPVSPNRVTVRLNPPASSSKSRNISQSFTSNVNSSNVSVPRYGSSYRETVSYSQKKKTCACSPTTHPGSYRCSLHKGNKVNEQNVNSSSSYRSSHQLNMRRSAMTNSLVRIGTVEGELVKRALASLIRPSSHSLRRRFDFQPRKSRLSIMSKAEDF